MPKKFIINNGNLIIGQVEFHKELQKGKNENNTIGGGYWEFDKENNIMYFYGSSNDFGGVTEAEFNAANKQQSIKNMKLIFSEKSLLSEILNKKTIDVCNHYF